MNKGFVLIWREIDGEGERMGRAERVERVKEAVGGVEEVAEGAVRGRGVSGGEGAVGSKAKRSQGDASQTQF